jgi:hypothetical protein
MFCSHSLKTNSQTQDTVALSSGKSEFYGSVEAATIGVGSKSLFGAFLLEMEMHANTEQILALR